MYLVAEEGILQSMPSGGLVGPGGGGGGGVVWVKQNSIPQL